MSLRDAIARLIGNAGRDHAAVGMPHQDHVAQIFEFEHRADVGDMRLEIDLGMCEVARARQGRYSRCY